MKRNRFTNPSCKFRIGSNIRKWRGIKDIKQKDLASALQVSESAVSNIENDLTNITIGELEEISIALNVSIEQLISGPQEKFRSSPAMPEIVIEKTEPDLIDKELITAIIASMEKKDQQLQLIMQHFIHTLARLMQQEGMVFNTPRQVGTRA